jgi:hypothetical protein
MNRLMETTVRKNTRRNAARIVASAATLGPFEAALALVATVNTPSRRYKRVAHNSPGQTQTATASDRLFSVNTVSMKEAQP